MTGKLGCRTFGTQPQIEQINNNIEREHRIFSAKCVSTPLGNDVKWRTFRFLHSFMSDMKTKKKKNGELSKSSDF